MSATDVFFALAAAEIVMSERAVLGPVHPPLYPQGVRRRPSVEYLPAPRRRPPPGVGTRRP
jgi:hypothetical protein